MVEVGATAVTPHPVSGRVFSAGRRVRLGDVSPRGRARFDAIARYLQDIARDDSADADYPEPMAWVVRRTLIQVIRLPRFQEWLDMATWCSGYGGRWAERSTSIRGESGGVVNAVAVWVHIDARDGTPRRLPGEFYDVWGESAAGRRVSARLQLPSKPAAGSLRLPWTMRAADLDVMNHMNNAAHWSALVEAVTRLNSPAAQALNDPDPSQTSWAELEHLAPIGADRQAELWAATTSTGTTTWLTTDGSSASIARLVIRN